MSEEKRNIWQRLNEVRKAVAYIQKKKAVEGYKAVEHDEVTAAIRPHLVEYGVFVVPQLVKSRIELTGTKTRNGTPIIRYEGKYQVDFVNMDEPEDKISVTVDAHANDHGDKAPGKAISYATKTAELKVLTLETGESDESRIKGEVETITEEQAADIQALIEELPNPEDAKKAVLAWAKVDSVEHIPADKYEKAVEGLEKRRAS